MNDHHTRQPLPSQIHNPLMLRQEKYCVLYRRIDFILILKCYGVDAALLVISHFLSFKSNQSLD